MIEFFKENKRRRLKYEKGNLVFKEFMMLALKEVPEGFELRLLPDYSGRLIKTSNGIYFNFEPAIMKDVTNREELKRAFKQMKDSIEHCEKISEGNEL